MYQGPYIQSQSIRYADFPGGLGKGYDAAIVGSWLSEFLEGIDPITVVPRRLYRGLSLGYIRVYIVYIRIQSFSVGRVYIDFIYKVEGLRGKATIRI